MRDENILRPISDNEQKAHEEFCRENKIPTKYYKQRNAIPVDFSQIDEFVQTYPTKLSARDLEQVRERLTVAPKTIEELYYKDLTKKIKRKLSFLGKKIFGLMLKEFNQTQIAKHLKVNLRTVNRHVKKIRIITRKTLKRVS